MIHNARIKCSRHDIQKCSWNIVKVGVKHQPINHNTWCIDLWLLGGFNVSAACIGTLIGAYVVYKFRMTPYNCIALIAVVDIIVCSFPILGLFIGCDNPEIIGYNVQR